MSRRGRTSNNLQVEHLAAMRPPPTPSQSFQAAVKVGNPFKLKRTLGRVSGPRNAFPGFPDSIRDLFCSQGPIVHLSLAGVPCQPEAGSFSDRHFPPRWVSCSRATFRRRFAVQQDPEEPHFCHWVGILRSAGFAPHPADRKAHALRSNSNLLEAPGEVELLD